jgi:small subunit ribosomal protein S21
LIEVKKKEKERFDSLLRRFNREVQQSGILTIVKKNRFFEQEPNRRMRRESSIRKNIIRRARRGY